MAGWRNRLRDSRIGLRLLALFVVAAAAPLGLLGWLAQRAIDEAQAQSQAEVLGATAKAASLQTLDRLRLARQSLLAAAPGPAATVTPPSPLAASGADLPPLQAVVRVDAGGRRSLLRDGPGAARLLEPGAVPAAGRAQLQLLPSAGGAPDLALRIPTADGGALVGLVRREFLWDGADELPPGVWLCTLDDQGAPLQCSQPGQAAAAARRLARAAGAEPAVLRSLFLGADFGTPDWHFVAGLDAHQSVGAWRTLRRELPVAALAALLLALLLALVQLRRTMGPLQALAAGARRIAQRDPGTRLAISGRDEFGALAGAFNHMAERVEAQFGELEMLASIDRLIVDGMPLRVIGAQIVQHLQRVLPRRAVAIAHWPATDATQLSCLVAGADAAPQLLRVVADPALLARAGAATQWAALPAGLAVPGLRQPWALPMRHRERCHGFLVLEGAPPDDAEARRQLDELCNRAAIAAGAAERERTLVHAARHDPVTGLLSRHGLDAALAQAVAACGPGEERLAVLYIDLDRFKAVNDSLGHAAGDQALRQVAERLRQHLPEHAQAARPAGDEFVVLLPRAGSGEAAGLLARTLCEQLAQPTLVGERLFFLHASIGLASCNDPRLGATTLLRQADQAMYQAKHAGGGRVARFDPQLDAQARRLAWIEAELPQAAERGELRLVYQPRLARDGRLAGVEALLRWRHPVHGDCPPGEFIPLAEQSALIEHLGRWVMEQACAQAAAWRDAGVGPGRVAINLSARQLESERLLPDLKAALQRHRLGGRELEVEVTEGLLVEPTGAVLERLHALRRLGLTIALDDFGTGYSSMSSLRSLPIDVLKIDRAFVQDIDRDPSALAVARAIVALAGSLGKRTVAEGVETPAQWHALEALQCDEVQGFLFSRPMEAAALAAWAGPALPLPLATP